MVRAAAGFTGLVAGMIACSLVTRPLFAGAAATDVLAWLLGLGAQAALALWGPDLAVPVRPAGRGRADAERRRVPAAGGSRQGRPRRSGV